MPRNLRKRSESSGEEDDESLLRERLEDLKVLQKLRKKPSGIDASALASGDTSKTNKKSSVNDDPWKIRSGGLVDMKRINMKPNDVRNNMNANFARETNQRDEDAEMQKFIEEQLRLKRGDLQAQNDETQVKIKKPEDALFDLPKHLITNTSKHKSEETLSEQMLSGIPEVDLGVEERIRNIEETDKAKQRLLMGLNTGKVNHECDKDAKSIDYVQHKRFEETNVDRRQANDKRKRDDSKPSTPVVVGDKEKHELLKRGRL
jgi:hypothetical protein